MDYVLGILAVLLALIAILFLAMTHLTKKNGRLKQISAVVTIILLGIFTVVVTILAFNSDLSKFDWLLMAICYVMLAISTNFATQELGKTRTIHIEIDNPKFLSGFYKLGDLGLHTYPKAGQVIEIKTARTTYDIEITVYLSFVPSLLDTIQYAKGHMKSSLTVY